MTGSFVLDLLGMILPSRMHVLVRRLRRQTIGSGVTIRFGTLIRAQSVLLGDGVKIGPLSVVYARSVVLERDSSIKPIALLKANRVRIGQQSQISSFAIISAEVGRSSSVFDMGSNSQIFPFCWVEPGEGVFIGDQVGVGGHGLIFTHGSWSNYFAGGPVARGPVHIEDRVWLPWRVFILPNVTIGADSIIGAGSVVNRSIEANTLAGGAPAKALRTPAIQELPDEDVEARINEVLDEMRKRYPDTGLRCSMLKDDSSSDSDVLLGHHVDWDAVSAFIERGCLVIDVVTTQCRVRQLSPVQHEAMSFLRTYGLRVTLTSC
jgi:acetyltransferase-like isoleucine patch superfamily enzyme